jgi:1-acyl-sn-glycerol-3-phosphate acyltransferase
MRPILHRTMNEPMSFFWSLFFVDPLIILSTLVFGAISVTQSLFDKTGNVMFSTARVWGRSLLAIAGVRVKVEGLEKVDLKFPCVFAANHLSYMDTPVILKGIPVPFRFMAKKGLFQIPFLGTHLAQAGHIPVPLEDPRASVKALSHGAKTIREHGLSIVVFPEGGRSEDGVLQEFKEGAAYIAIKAGVPLVPVALVGTRQILAMHSSTFHSGAVTLRFGEPISTEGLTLHARGELTARLRERIVEMLSAP